MGELKAGDQTLCVRPCRFFCEENQEADMRYRWMNMLRIVAGGWSGIK